MNNEKDKRSSRAERQRQQAVATMIRDRKLELFGVSSAAAIEAWDRYGDTQEAKYGALGLRRVRAADMPVAIDSLFARLDLRQGERLLEIGPGPHGGVSVIAALMGLHVVVVEYDHPFSVDVDTLRAQLTAAGSSNGLAQLAGLSGPMTVHPYENLVRLVKPIRPLIAAAGGTLDIVPGDFADPTVQQQSLALGPIDHVICTDVISPMGDTFSRTTALLTTGDEAKSTAILEGVVRAATGARTLSTGFLVAEQSPECGERIAQSYRLLEDLLATLGRSFSHEPVISPSSGTVCRSRLYRLR